MSGSTMLMAISSSGAVTITGEMSGSDAANALLLEGTGSLTFTTTASYNAFTSSYNTASSSLSSRTSQIEQVYATTGSNSFRATQSITGSLTVTGQIIAQTLNVQQVTSSIIFSTGSNTFGCDLNNRQTFTGSFFQTGSIASFSTCVGIGTSAPNAFLHINGTPGQSNPSIRLTDSSVSGNGGNVFISADKSGVGYNNLTTIAFSHTFKGGGSATNYLTIDSNGVSCFASQICAPSIVFLSNTNSGYNPIKICNPNPGSSAFSEVSLFNNTTSQAGLFYNSSARTADGGACSFSLYNDSTNGNIRLRTGNNIVLATGAPATDKLTIISNGVACFSNIVCAAGFSTSGFLRAHNAMRTFAISKNFGERESDANYFRISSSAANGYQVMIYSVAQNGSVGWVQSQLYQAATAPYWGGWVGTDGAVTTTGSGAGYISSIVNGNDGTITFRVTTGNNGTNTTGTILSYIQVTAFNIDDISITAL